MNLIPDRFQHAAKGVVAATGAAALTVVQLAGALAPGLPDAVAPVVSIVVAVATFVGVYLVPNLTKILDADPDELEEQAAQLLTQANVARTAPDDPGTDTPAADA